MSDHVTPPTLHAMPEAHCALDIVPARTDYGRDGEHMVWRLVRCPHCGSDSHTLRASFSNPLGALRRNPIYRCPDSAGWARLEIAPWNLDEPRPVAGSLVLTADGMAWQIAECPDRTPFSGPPTVRVLVGFLPSSGGRIRLGFGS
jgi:hypothetical protein